MYKEKQINDNSELNDNAVSNEEVKEKKNTNYNIMIVGSRAYSDYEYV